MIDFHRARGIKVLKLGVVLKAENPNAFLLNGVGVGQLLEPKGGFARIGTGAMQSQVARIEHEKDVLIGMTMLVHLGHTVLNHGHCDELKKQEHSMSHNHKAQKALQVSQDSLLLSL